MIRTLAKTVALAIVIGALYAIVARGHGTLRAVVILTTFAVSIVLDALPRKGD